MQRILYLLSSESCLEAERGLPMLCDASAQAGVRADVFCLGGAPSERLRRAGVAHRSLAAARGSVLDPLTVTPGLRNCLENRRPDVVHAWDPLAAMCAAQARPDLSIALSVDHPADADRVAKWRRSNDAMYRVALICPAEIVRRRLVEQGAPIERTVVIRPGVDFSFINAVDAAKVRADLGIEDAGPIIAAPGPPVVGDGQLEVVWAVALLQQVWPNIRVLMPGVGAEAQRLRRFVESFQLPQILVCTDDRYAFWELLKASDACLCGAQRDASSTPLAWAMAASVPIVGPAIHAVAELIADRQNGLLCKRGLPRMLASRMMELLDDRDLGRAVAEHARGQAFEVFGRRRFVDQHRQVYDNLLKDRLPSDNIKDAALAG